MAEEKKNDYEYVVMEVDRAGRITYTRRDGTVIDKEMARAAGILDNFRVVDVITHENKEEEKKSSSRAADASGRGRGRPASGRGGSARGRPVSASRGRSSSGRGGARRGGIGMLGGASEDDNSNEIVSERVTNGIRVTLDRGGRITIMRNGQIISGPSIPERADPRGPLPLSAPSQPRQIPGSEYKNYFENLSDIEKKEKKQGQNCSVCIEDLTEEKNDQITLLKCGHIFHTNCIKDWFASRRGNSRLFSGSAPSCPLCRSRDLLFGTKKSKTKSSKRKLVSKVSKHNSSKRKSLKRKSLKHKTSKRKSLKRKTSKRKSPKRKSLKRKTSKRKSPKRK